MIWLEILPEVVAIAFFHMILYTNHRRSPQMNVDYLKRRVLVSSRRDGFEMIENTQIESNKRVFHIILPVLWAHLGFTALTIFGIFLYPYVRSNRGDQRSIFHLNQIVPNYTVTSWYISMESVNVIQMFPCALAGILFYKVNCRFRLRKSKNMI